MPWSAPPMLSGAAFLLVFATVAPAQLPDPEQTHHVRENCAFVAASLSPLYERAGLRDPGCVSWTLLQKATLVDFAEGNVYRAPPDQLGSMPWIPGFVTHANFPKTVAVAEQLGYVPKGQCQDAAALDAALQRRFPADEVAK